MRFGFWPNPRSSWPELVELSQHAERTGWDGIWYADHFMPAAADNSGPTNESWAFLSALAAIIPRVRIGHLVCGNTYRHPAVVAKMAAGVDHVSGGRFVLGLGAGWQENEHRAYGIPLFELGERMGRLDEACHVIRGLLREERTTFPGKYYQLDGAICRPRPVQDPHIPFWIAGGGEQLTLNVAARYAAYTNFGISVDEFTHKSEVLRGHCDDVGRDFNDIVRTTNFFVVCEETEKDVEDRLGWIRNHYGKVVSEEQAERTLRLHRRMAGTPEQLVERLQPWVDAGATYSILFFAEAGYDTSGMERFAREVIPAMSA